LINVQYADYPLIKPLKKLIIKVPQHKTIIKHSTNGFSSPKLKEVIEKWDISTLAFMGIYASACVCETAQTTLNLELKVCSAYPLIGEPLSYRQKEGKDIYGAEWFRQNGEYFDNYRDLIKIIT